MAKNSVDFSDCALDYSLLTGKEYIPIFKFIENYGCKFNKNEPYFNFSFYQPQPNYSPFLANIKRIGSYDYDINTLIFLVKYANNDELEQDVLDNQNIIDIFINFNRFDGIMEVYKKLGKIIYPKQITNHSYLFYLDRYAPQELIEFTHKHK